MKEQFADYETSKMLKELGFDNECLGYYTTSGKLEQAYSSWATNSKQPHVSMAPLWQQIKQWLWEKHKISIHPSAWNTITGGFSFDIVKDKSNLFPINKNTTPFPSPITAEIEGIKQAVQYLHKNKKS